MSPLVSVMNALRNSAARLVFAAACFFCATCPAVAAAPGFLQIEAIEGEAQPKGYKNWIDIQSFAFGTTRSVGSGPGLISGPPQLSAIKITKRIDRASPLLFQSAVKGGPIPNVVIDFLNSAQQGESRFLQIVLSDALVTGYETHATGNSTNETVWLHFARIEIDVRQRAGGTVRAYYDLATSTGGELPGEPPPNNKPPVISALPDQSVEANGAVLVAFEISDANTAPGFLTVTGDSSNPAVVPAENIVLSGSGGTRTATITPAPATVGSSLITLTVSDGNLSASSTFTLTVTSDTNVLISQVEDAVTGAGETVLIPFLIGHASLDPSLLTVSAATDDESLIPPGNIVITGTGAERIAAITPALGKIGSTAITLTVSDGSESVSAVFQLTVEATAPPPAISAPAVVKAVTGNPVYLDGISITDPSAAESPILLQLTVPSGMLTIATAIPGGVTPGQVAGNGSAAVSITAPLDAIHTTLEAAAGVSYTNEEAGVFELSLEASRSGSSTATIRIELYDTGFTLWQSDQFSPAALADPEQEATVWGSLARPAGDGLPNLVKYAFGLRAMEPHIPAEYQALTVASEGEQRFLMFTMLLRSDDPALSCAPEFSPDLKNWESGPDAFDVLSVTPAGDSFQQIVYGRPIDGDASNAFVRLHVTYGTE